MKGVMEHYGGGNNFISYKDKKNIKSALRREYTQARESFDKALKRAERAYKKSVANDIETMSSTNPNEFWNKIRKLGPRNNNNIPMEVLNEDGTILTTERDVFPCENVLNFSRIVPEYF